MNSVTEDRNTDLQFSVYLKALMTLSDLLQTEINIVQTDCSSIVINSKFLSQVEHSLPL